MKNHLSSIVLLTKEDQLTMKLTAFTHLAFLINRIIDAGPDTDPSFREIFDAACDGELIKLLAARYGHLADFSFLLSRPARFQQMEAALRDAAAGFDGHGDQATGPLSGLCLVMDIVINAIQQQFRSSPPRSPEAEPDQQFPPCVSSNGYCLALAIVLEPARQSLPGIPAVI